MTPAGTEHGPTAGKRMSDENKCRDVTVSDIIEDAKNAIYCEYPDEYRPEGDDKHEG